MAVVISSSAYAHKTTIILRHMCNISDQAAAGKLLMYSRKAGGRKKNKLGVIMYLAL